MSPPVDRYLRLIKDYLQSRFYGSAYAKQHASQIKMAHREAQDLEHAMIHLLEEQVRRNPSPATSYFKLKSTSKVEEKHIICGASLNVLFKAKNYEDAFLKAYRYLLKESHCPPSGKPYNLLGTLDFNIMLLLQREEEEGPEEEEKAPYFSSIIGRLLRYALDSGRNPEGILYLQPVKSYRIIE